VEPHLAISELRLVDALGPLAFQTQERNDRADVVRGNLENTALLGMLGRRYAPACPDAANPRGTFILRADLDVDASAGSVGGVLRVLDGVWSPRGGAAPWSRVQLTGRVRSVGTVVEPVAGPLSGSVLEEVDLALAERLGELGPKALERLGEADRACVEAQDPGDEVADLAVLRKLRALLVTEPAPVAGAVHWPLAGVYLPVE
jgi:hypothetical protein